ncbi:hypothetical protein N7507_002310 [Penicillium longicatenatum]|nr:hypothetical protein N7507_002310 [Penicillium longicatenatum]
MVIAAESRQDGVHIKTVHMISDQENTSPDEVYEPRKKSYYPFAPCVHAICWSALNYKKSIFRIFSFGLAMLPSLDVTIPNNFYASV